MKILHLTDLHYSTQVGGLTKQKKIISELIENVSIKERNQFDLIIFSGDLVNDGSISTSFEKAKNDLIQPLLNKLKLTNSNFIFCGGNHDIDRSKVSKYVVKYIDEELTDNEKLNNFFKNKDGNDYKTSILPMSNFNNFIKEFYNIETNIENNLIFDLYSIHFIEKEGLKFGIVSINTAWRAVGINDDNKLLFPISVLNEALDKIIDCEKKILIHHHPINDFQIFNKYELEDEINKRFDFVFSGHYHKNSFNVDYTFNDGAIKIGSPACLTNEKGVDIGYSVIDININEDIVSVQSNLFNSKYENFYSLDLKELSIPTSHDKNKLNHFRKNIRKRLIEELENTKSLFVETEQDENKTILDLSTEPVLNEKSITELQKEGVGVNPDFKWEHFYYFDNDFIIFGKDKSGKTILLKKIEVQLLSEFSTHDFIPFYIDFKAWKNSSTKFNFIKEFSKYYFINQKDAQELFNEKQIVLLIDNFHIENIVLKEYLISLLQEHNNIKLIICSADTLLSTFENTLIDGRVLKKLHFHRLRKKHIKQLTKINTTLSEKKQNEIVDKIENIFNKLSIPFNFWTVSIFLWIFKKDINANFQNDVELINLYIEKLIEKEQLTINRSRFSFANYKKLLANLAHFLLIEKHQDSYYAKYSEIVTFIDDYLSKNPRYNISSREIFEYLDEKGIFRKKEDDLYSFRLNGVFEYFIAQYMTLDKKFLKGVINDDSYYLSFTNEFELYAGFKRDNISFLKKIYNKTKDTFNRSEINYTLDIDLLLKEKVTEANEFSQIVDKITSQLKNGLSDEEIDEIERDGLNEFGLEESNSEVKTKKINEIDTSADSLGSCLQILGKVYKNTDDINDIELVYEIFDYIIDNAILWGFKLVDEFKNIGIQKITEYHEDAKYISRVLTQFIPTLVQVRLNEMIGHVTLEKIIFQRLNESLSNYKTNQYKLFLYTFLLLDINLDHNIHLLESVAPKINISLIKYSFIIKLNYYLGFKTNEDKELKKILEKYIQQLYIKFKGDSELGELHKGFSDKQNKRGLIK